MGKRSTSSGFLKLPFVLYGKKKKEVTFTGCFFFFFGEKVRKGQVKSRRLGHNAKLSALWGTRASHFRRQ
jgi:hypothetical protein